jgi:hypothetical protein
MKLCIVVAILCLGLLSTTMARFNRSANLVVADDFVKSLKIDHSFPATVRKLHRLSMVAEVLEVRVRSL